MAEQQPRLKYYEAAPELFGELQKLSTKVHHSGLEPGLLTLVDIRASQLNGCAFCLDMHSKQAKLLGERELRLYMLPAWRESSLFTPRERAALAWTEAVTQLGPHGVPDSVYEEAAGQFQPAELANLTLAMSIINAWNRLGVSFRSVPGSLDKVMGLDKAGLK